MLQYISSFTPKTFTTNIDKKRERRQSTVHMNAIFSYLKETEKKVSHGEVLLGAQKTSIKDQIN